MLEFLIGLIVLILLILTGLVIVGILITIVNAILFWR
jgi:hypothetical protein